jgi:hypothetical protein
VYLHSHGRRPRNNQKSNQGKTKECKDDNKQVPIKYEAQPKRDPPTVELKYTLNTRVCKESVIVFENSSPEECLKWVKEFQNIIDTYSLWNRVAAEAATIVY